MADDDSDETTDEAQDEAQGQTVDQTEDSSENQAKDQTEGDSEEQSQDDSDDNVERSEVDDATFGKKDDEPANEVQMKYMRPLAEEQDEEIPDDMSEADAAEKINEMQENAAS